MSDAKRTQTKAKVSEGEARNKARTEKSTLDRAGETAIDAKDRFTAFAKEHPITTIAGGLALGILVSGLFRGSPTRKMVGRVGSRASELANVGAELAMAYAAQALAATEDVRKTSADKLGELGDAAVSYGKTGSDAASEVARSAGKRIAKAIHGRFN